MKKAATKRNWITKLRHKYRLIVYNDNTFEEVFYVRLSRLNVFIGTGIIVLLLILLNTYLIAYTPLKEFIPGYPSSDMMRSIQNNAIQVSELEEQIQVRDNYIYGLKRILSGEVNDSLNLSMLKTSDTSKTKTKYNFKPSTEDSLLRNLVENEDKFSLSIQSDEQNLDLKKMIFFSPVKGVITNKFNASKKHFGIDLVAKPNEMVMSALDGFVIASHYSLETGNVVIIQHKDNIITVYKHLSRILKSQGSQVKAGEAIGVLGNSGEYTSGPHLHFEVWYKGEPVNPQNYIVF